MNHGYSGHNEWEEEVECEEPCQGCVINREAASDSLDKGAADVRDSGEKVCDYSSSSE